MGQSVHRFSLSRRRFLLGSAAVAGAAFISPLLAACGSTSGTATKNTDLTFSYSSDADTLDPALTTASTTMYIQSQMFEGLFRMGRDGKYEGLLATSWENLDDRTWKFTLRDNVKFHNGEEFNAEAYKIGFERLRDGETAAAPFVAAIESIEAPDPRTVIITMKTPIADAFPVISYIKAVPPAYLREKGDEGFAASPVGTGAFAFVEHKKDIHLTLKGFGDYWGGKPAVDNLTFRPIPEPSARIAALQNGEVDWIAAIDVDRSNDLQNNDDFRVVSMPGQGIYCGLNTLNFEPFKDKRVRQAMNYGVDMDSIVRDLFLGMARRAPSALFSSTPGYDPDLKPYPYDPDKAKQLLTEAGYADGFAVELTTRASQSAQKFKDVAEAIQQDLGKLGVTVSIKISNPAASTAEYAEGKWQMYIMPWGSHVSGVYIQTLLQSDTRGYYYQSAEADEYIRAFMSAIDPAERVEAGKKMNLFFQDECPWLFLYEEPQIFGVRSRVEWTPNQYDWTFRAADVSFR